VVCFQECTTSSSLCCGTSYNMQIRYMATIALRRERSRMSLTTGQVPFGGFKQSGPRP
jgi:hypothetical protein